MIYQHKGSLVLISVYQKVDSHEIITFLQAVYKYLQEFSYKKTGGMDLTSQDNELGSCFQEYNAEQLYVQIGKEVTTFQTEWNRNPANRSKTTQLFEQLVSAKEAMQDAQRESLKRGEKTELLLNKSEELMVTSVEYKKTAKQVKTTMCQRKWKMIMWLVLIVVVLVLLLWLLFFKL